MKITTILGSSRTNGNTGKVLDMFENMVSGKNNEVDRIHLTKGKVNGCMGCLKCQSVIHSQGCVQKDSSPEILQKIIESDAVVYASPLYFWGISSQLKAIVDRHYCLVTGYGSGKYNSLIENKTMALMVTCNGPAENNADLLATFFSRLTKYCKAKALGPYILPLCASDHTLRKDGKELASRMAVSIAKVRA